MEVGSFLPLGKAVKCWRVALSEADDLAVGRGDDDLALGDQSETVASLKDLRLAPGPDENTQVSIAPDGSPVFTRDIGTQEIYALSVKWP